MTAFAKHSLRIATSAPLSVFPSYQRYTITPIALHLPTDLLHIYGPVADTDVVI